MQRMTTIRLMDLYHCNKWDIQSVTKLRLKKNIVKAKRNSLITNRESYLWHLKTANEK